MKYAIQVTWVLYVKPATLKIIGETVTISKQLTSNVIYNNNNNINLIKLIKGVVC